MRSVEPRVIAVRQGDIRPSGSWLYIWVDIADGAVAFVGATGVDPELRAHVHLTSDNPDHGRVRATVPRYQERDFDVLSFRLPDDVRRSEAKNALVAELAARGEIAGEGPVVGTLSEIIDPIIDSLENYRRGLRAPQ